MIQLSKPRILFLFVSFAFTSYSHAQHRATSGEIRKEYHDNGSIRQSLSPLRGDTFCRVNYYPSGEVKDSCHVTLEGKNQIPFGTKYNYYESGRLRSIATFMGSTKHYYITTYSTKGKKVMAGEFPAGERLFFNKKGKQDGQAVMISKSIVLVPRDQKNYLKKNQPAWAERITTHDLYLQSASRSGILRSGTMVSAHLRGQEYKMPHLLIEGFSRDSIYFSAFHLNQEWTKESGGLMLIRDSVFVCPLTQVDSIFYSRTLYSKRYINIKKWQNTGAVCTLMCVALPFTLTTAGPAAIPVTGAALATVLTSLYMGSSGRARSTIPKQIRLSDYTISYGE